MKAVVAYGNPFCGLRFIGPFEDDRAAATWAEIELDDVPHWWVIEPERYEGDEHAVVVSRDDDGLVVTALCDDPQRAAEYVEGSAYANRHVWTQAIEKPRSSPPMF
ncbi:MAG: hypothetical protein J0I74_15435 [Rhodanobacter sp.]|jgi:hypothetical protein|nr:hypothetical protein [Rhodanobacter sp.]